MSKPLKHIEEQYSEAFKSESHKDLHWNSPPDFVFEDAIASVTKSNKRKNKRRVLLLIVSTILIISSSAILHTQLRINGLEKTVVSLKEATLESTPKIPYHISPVEKPTSITSIANKHRENKISAHLHTGKTTSNTITKNPADITPSSGLTQNLKIKESSSINVNLLEAPFTIHKTIAGEKISNPAELAKPALLNSEVSPLHITERILESIEFPFATLENLSTDESEAIWESGVQLKNNFSSLRMEGELNSDQILRNYGNLCASYGIEISGERKLAKGLSIIGSIAYDRYKNHSQASNSYNYSKANEEPMTNGMASYSMSNLIQTPMGIVEDDMYMIVDPNTTSEGETLLHESAISQTLNTFSIHAGFSFDLLRKGKFNLSSGIVSGLNYNHRVNSILNSSLLMHNHIMDVSEVTYKDTKGTRKYFGTLRINLEASLALKNDFYLNLGLGYTQSTSTISMRKSYPQFKLTNWHNSLGLTKRF